MDDGGGKTITGFREQYLQYSLREVRQIIGGEVSSELADDIVNSLWRWIGNRLRLLDRPDTDWKTVVGWYARCAVVHCLGADHLISRCAVGAAVPPHDIPDGRELTDLPLIQAIQNGRKDSYAALWRIYRDELRGYIRLRCLSVPIGDQDDFEAWLYIFMQKDFAAFDPERARFGVFLKNRVFFLQRRYSRQTAVGKDVPIEEETGGDWGGPVVVPVETDEGPEETVIDDQEARERECRVCAYLETILSLPSPPHQLLAFGFNRLMEWPPRKIVADLWLWRLFALAELLGSTSVVINEALEVPLANQMGALNSRLAQPLCEVLSHPKARATYKSLLEADAGQTMPCGELRLGDHACGAPAEDHEPLVTRWASNVVRQLAEVRQTMRDNLAGRAVEK